MTPDQETPESYVSVAEVEIDAVMPAQAGFVLTGRGRDGADYRFEMALEMPIDERTRTILGGLLAQSEWRVLRRAPRQMAAGRARRASRRARS